VDWDLALPKCYLCLALQRRLDPAFRLSEPPFHAAMISWLDALGPARFTTFVCDSVAVSQLLVLSLVDPAFTVALNNWLDAISSILHFGPP
jgi:hypothetical protein